MYGKKGLILLDSALILESEMSYLSNNNVIIVSATKDIQRQRLIERGYSTLQIDNRMNSQFNKQLKQEMLSKCINKDCHGKLWNIENSKAGNDKLIEDLFDNLAKAMKLESLS